MTTQTDRLESAYWDRQYEQGPVWDVDFPCTELRRVVRRWQIEPCRALELGCGTGASAIWLAERGFDVTAMDVSRVAIRRARRRLQNRSAKVRFIAGDLRDWQQLEGPFSFFFDGGCYHAVRRDDAQGYFHTLQRVIRPGGLGLILTGNANEPEDDLGPPVLTEEELCRSFAGRLHILALRSFRFDALPGARRYLGWSVLVRKLPTPRDR